MDLNLSKNPVTDLEQAHINDIGAIIGSEIQNKGSFYHPSPSVGAECSCHYMMTLKGYKI